MGYTTLRVVEAGVVLHDEHLRRLAPGGGPLREAFEGFARSAAPGVYALRTQGDSLQVERRPESRLVDGMPVRFLVSPYAGAGPGAFAKPAPPSPYDGVRLPGVATLLTSADGAELYEGCVAAVVGWDGQRFVCVPADRPRVASTAEAALRHGLPVREAPLLREEGLALVLLNAVKGPCRLSLPGRAPLPPAALAALERLLEASVWRPR